VKFFTKFLRGKKRLANIAVDVSRAANFWRPFDFGKLMEKTFAKHWNVASFAARQAEAQLNRGI
jgi:hypothetical protein